MNPFEEQLYRLVQESKNKISPFSSAEEDAAKDLQLILNFSKEWDFRDKYHALSKELKQAEERLVKLKDETTQKVTMTILKEIIPVMDAAQQLHRHLERTDTEFKGSATEGAIRILRDSLERILLTRDGYIIYPNQGEDFNPEIHYAIAAEHVPGLRGNLIEDVYRCGYSILNQVIRPAEVKVKCGVSPG